MAARASGLFVLGSAFLDAAKNNYPVDVQVPDARGRLQPATVRRFHDDYRAGGLTLEAGVVDRPWAKRLSVRGFVSSYDKDLQHNVVMTVPYGEVRSGETAYGATARWEVKPARDLELSLVGSWAHRRIDFVDASPWVYDWYGRRLRPRRVRGEIESSPTDQVVDQDALFARGLLAWTVHPQHVLRGSVTPQFTTRTGDERIEANSALRDPLTARRDLVTIVSGVEYEANLLGDRLSNVAFVKDYGYRARSEEPLPGGVFRQRRSTEHALGVGDAVRYRFTSWLLAKASYEFARRLPRPDEVFGNGVLVRANLGLEPEVSHNVNLGPRLDLRRTRIGDVMVDVNAFLRESDRLIVLLGSDTSYTHQNVYAARGVGLENAIAYATPGRVVTVDGTLTWQDVRNTSSEGTFGDTDGDRIPNRPWLFASWGARLRIPGLPDPVEPFYVGRYVHGFFRGWESKGLREFKQTVDAQVSHNLGVSWTVVRDAARVTSTFEVDNVTDERLYDNFGVQRPGRSFFVKLVGEI